MHVKQTRIYNLLIHCYVLCNTLSKHPKASQKKTANKRQLTRWPFWFNSHRHPSVMYQKFSGISCCFADSVVCYSHYLLQNHLLGYLISCGYSTIYKGTSPALFLCLGWTLKVVTKISECFRMTCYSVPLSSVGQGKMFIWRYLDPDCWLLIWSHAFKIIDGSTSEFASTQMSCLWFKQDTRKCRANICFIFVFWNSLLPLYWAWAHFAIFWTFVQNMINDVLNMISSVLWIYLFSQWFISVHIYKPKS